VVDLASATANTENVVRFSVDVPTSLTWTAPTTSRYETAIVAISPSVETVVAYLPINCDTSGKVDVILTKKDQDVTSFAIRKKSTIVSSKLQVTVGDQGTTLQEHLLEAAGCFPRTARVLMNDGHTKAMHALRIGDSTSSGAVTNWIHQDVRNVKVHNYIRIETSSGKSLTVSKKHIVRFNGAFDFAERARIGDVMHTASGKEETIVAVIHVDHNTRDLVEVNGVVRSRAPIGYYAPLTSSGLMVVDGFQVSCFAEIPCASHRFAQLLFSPMHYAPFRAAVDSSVVVDRTAPTSVVPSDETSTSGLHWYPAVLMRAWNAIVDTFGDVCDRAETTAE
jgi:hypothetical protein